ncbi:GAF domain-containing protein [Reinekea marina]|uniref:GAF domain-containing protein n=2 Tax=Reinekea marina TaxID=1310421 RepID=A0ABV7WSC1_9GAMM
MANLVQINPDNQKEQMRLDAVHALKLGNLEVQERLDRITRIAKRMFAVKMADFSLIRQRDQQMVSVSGGFHSTIPKEHSFAAYALHKHEIFYVPDTLKDDRFSGNPQVVSQPKIRFFATCPIQTSTGQRVGALTLSDTEPRTLNAHEQSILKDLAEMFENELSFSSLATLDRSTNMVMNQGFYSIAEQSLKGCHRNHNPAVMIVFKLHDAVANISEPRSVNTEKNVKTFAEHLKRMFRQSDVVGRLDQDEFAALLINARCEQVLFMIKKLQARLDAYNKDAKLKIPLEFSYSMAEFDPEHPVKTELLMANAHGKSAAAVGF